MQIITLVALFYDISATKMNSFHAQRLLLKTLSVIYLLASPVAAFLVIPALYRDNGVIPSMTLAANTVLGAPFSKRNFSPPIRMSTTEQQQQQSAPPPDAFVESLKLRVTLWAVDYFGIVSSDKLPYQTLGFILNFMNKMKVYDLLFAPYWKERLEDCVKVVVAEQEATKMINPNEDLVGTTWRLAYTNDFAVMPPSRRMAYLTFEDPKTMRYSFRTNVEGWQNVEAQCPYQINAGGSAASSGDTLTFVFQQVTVEGCDDAAPTDGRMYGMRQGSSRTLQTAFFDGQYWIDFSGGEASSNKMTIYVKKPERYNT